MTTKAQRKQQAKNKADERQRKREAGLVPVEAWIYHTRKEEFARIIENFQKDKEGGGLSPLPKT